MREKPNLPNELAGNFNLSPHSRRGKRTNYLKSRITTPIQSGKSGVFPSGSLRPGDALKNFVTAATDGHMAAIGESFAAARAGCGIGGFLHGRCVASPEIKSRAEAGI